MSQSGTSRIEDLPFGEALSELEGIVAALESGQLDLEDSLARYERGVALLRVLQAKLADAQQRVTVLMGDLEQPTDDAPVAAGAGDSEEVPF